MAEQSYKSVWNEICESVNTAEGKKAIGDAEDNANDTSIEDEGYKLFSEDWYRVALVTYEFLIEQ